MRPVRTQISPCIPRSLIRIFVVRMKKKQTFHPSLPKMRQVKILIRLRGCAGWSESSLGAHIRWYVFWCYGSIIKHTPILWFYCIILCKKKKKKGKDSCVSLGFPYDQSKENGSSKSEHMRQNGYTLPCASALRTVCTLLNRQITDQDQALRFAVLFRLVGTHYISHIWIKPLFSIVVPLLYQMKHLKWQS